MVQFYSTFPRSHKRRLGSETPRANNRGTLGLHGRGQYLKRNAVLCSVVSDSLRPHGLQPTRLLCPWDFSTYWSRLLCPPPGDLPDQGLNSCLLHGRRILYHCATWEAPQKECCKLSQQFYSYFIITLIITTWIKRFFFLRQRRTTLSFGIKAETARS